LTAAVAQGERHFGRALTDPRRRPLLAVEAGDHEDEVLAGDIERLVALVGHLELDVDLELAADPRVPTPLGHVDPDLDVLRLPGRDRQPSDAAPADGDAWQAEPAR
jgi:hypothetical protein